MKIIVIVLLILASLPTLVSQGIVIKSCESAVDPVECSSKFILSELSKNYSVKLGQYLGVRLTFGRRGNLDGYKHLTHSGDEIGVNEDVIYDVLKKTVRKVSEECYGKEFDLMFFIDSLSNFHFLDSSPVYPKVGYLGFNKLLDELYEEPDTVFGYVSVVAINLDMRIDSLGNVVPGSGRIGNHGRIDYRIQEAGMSMLKKLEDIKWSPRIVDNVATSDFCRVSYWVRTNFVPSGEMLKHYRTYMGPYFDNGLKMLKDGKLDLSIKQFGKALFIAPDDVDALYNRGAAYFMKKDVKNACLDWKRAAENGDKKSLGLLNAQCQSK
jgi:tetratricopeptide (TPR) repeat protein